MQDFSGFNFPQEIQDALTRLKFVSPTPIQVQAIPIALEGQDVLGSAQTGTGKTAAFILPIVAKLMADKSETALVLTPTRELAKQVFDFAVQVAGRNSGVRGALLIGGAPIYPQLRQLNMGARLIVGTPGRVNDHLSRNGLLFENARILVLDETDLMLDMGFSEQIDDILEYMPQKRQTLLFSATLPKAIISMADKYLTNPKRIAAGEANKVAKNIVEDIVYTTKEEKYNELVKALDIREGAVIVFVKTKIGADQITKKLQKVNYQADVLHGGLRQSRRDRVTKLFRNKRFRIMIATDVAARGLDIPHIQHVINYDMPDNHEDYIHRIGRTARAEASGHALSLLTSRQQVKNIKEFFDLSKGRPSSRSRGGKKFGSGGWGRRDGGNGGRSSGGGGGRSSGGRSSYGRSSEGGSSSEGRSYGGRSSSSRSSEGGSSSEGRSYGGRSSSSRSSEGGSSSEGRSYGGRSSSSRSSEGGSSSSSSRGGSRSRSGSNSSSSQGGGFGGRKRNNDR
jgi:ATP-dependent RNA helicase DeaD